MPINSLVRVRLRLFYPLILGSIFLLLLILPIQTPLVTWLIIQNNFPENIALWKELVSFLLISLVLLDILLIIFFKRKSLQFQSLFESLLPLIITILLCCWALVTSILHNSNLQSIIYGFRFELWWVIILSSLWSWVRVNQKINPEFTQHSNYFQKYLASAVYLGFALVSALSLTIIFFGSNNILQPLGYGQVSEFSTFQAPPICQRVDAFEDKCRLGGGFSLPNHFAGYLLLVLGVFISSGIGWYNNRILRESNQLKCLLLVTVTALNILLSILFIFLSYTRFAWLGLGMIISFALWYLVRRLILIKFPQISEVTIARMNKLMLGLIVLIPVLVGIVGINLPPQTLSQLPVSIAKPASTAEHYNRTMASLEVLSQDSSAFLFGYGLGTSGPAAKPEYVNPESNYIFVTYNHIAYNWWLVGEDLLVPENWYVQLIFNGGIIYAIIYISLILYLISRIVNKSTKYSDSHLFALRIIQLALVSLVIGNLFLHIWENQTVAIYFALISSGIFKVKVDD